MLIITEPQLDVDPETLAGRERDTLSLSWEERRWNRKRAVTSAGREVGLALPTGSVLRAGAVIAVEADWYLVVEPRPEPLLAVSPRDRTEAVRVAFEVGNRHFSLAVDGACLLVPDDSAMEQLLARLGVAWERRLAVYEPIGGGHRHDADATPGDTGMRSAGRSRTATQSAVPDASAVDSTAPSSASASAFLSLLQFADTALPTGGYAHSFGLERYCQAGLVTDAEGVQRFLLAQLEGSAGPGDATAAVGVRRAIRDGDVAACRALDETLEAMKAVREFREGSRQMGRQTLRISAALTGDTRLAAYLHEVDEAIAPGHHAVAFGMAAGVLDWGAEETAAAFLYSTTSLLVGAALRLLPIGQSAGQRVLWELHPVIARVAREAVARDPGDLWAFAPGLDIQGMLHERLDTRLFRS